MIESNSFSKTKIVCTVGPASDNKEVLTKLVKAGMDVMRLNFSHGDHESHKEKLDMLQEINQDLDTNVACLLDTKGPEIRTGDFVDGGTEFKNGQVCVICIEDIVGTSERFTVTYKDLYKDVKPGGFILVDDGQISLLVDHIEGTDIVTVCANDGFAKNRRGINVPNIKLSFDYLSEKDRADLEFGCKNSFSYVAASFTRRAQDVLDIKKILVANRRNDIQIIAKIENIEGVENIDEILKVADGVMVARGDLGVEVPAEEVPFIQKKIIRKAKSLGKVVITATQMLESMQSNPRPTRAEVSDVANAIYDGTDAIMLSGESANGKYPHESVLMMSRIASFTEANLDYDALHATAVKTAGDGPSEAICMSAAEIAMRFNVAAIIAFTETGFTARKMSRYRPHAPIIAATPSVETMEALSLSWGVKPCSCVSLGSRASMIDYAQIIAKENNVKAGQLILVTGGTPGLKGDTSYLELVRVL